MSMPYMSYPRIKIGEVFVATVTKSEPLPLNSTQ